LRNIAFALFVISSAIAAQNFSVSIDNTELADTLGSEIIFEFEITNNTDADLSLYFLRYENVLPEGWSSSLCFDYCFAPHLDSIVTNSQFGSSPIAGDETRTFSVHVFPFSGTGTANISIRIANLNDENDFYDFSLTANGVLTAVNNDQTISKEFDLYQNYPNPFNPETTISYSVDQEGYGSLDVIDILGNSIMKLKEGYFKTGYYTLNFSSEEISSGIYFYRLRINDKMEIKKMIVSK
jgi:hypothetical protein